MGSMPVIVNRKLQGAVARSSDEISVMLVERKDIVYTVKYINSLLRKP